MRTLIVGMIGLILSGCATTWHSDRFPTEELKQAQLGKDVPYCKAVSYGTVPMPSAPPIPQSYNVQGTMTGYGHARHSDYSFTGTVAPQTNFSTGFAQGMALGAVMRANRQQEEVFNACMISLGWSDKPAAAPQLEASQATKRTSRGTPISEDEDPIACYVEQPSSKSDDDILVLGNFFINSKARTISTAIYGGTRLEVRTWDGGQIVATEKTTETYETSPPVTKTWVYFIDTEKLTLGLTYAWVTNNGLMLDEKQLEAVAKSHPLYLVEKGIVPARGVVEAKCLRMPL